MHRREVAPPASEDIRRIEQGGRRARLYRCSEPQCREVPGGVSHVKESILLMSHPKALATRALRGLRRVGNGVLDLVYPSRCLGCGARPESPQLPLCPRCLSGLERARPMEVAARLERLPTGGSAVETAHALWVFDKGGTLQAVQHALKYENRPRYGVPLGRLMGAAYAERHPPPDGVVPLPLHRTRRLERGYNQSAPLAEGAAAHLECPYRSDLLMRPHPTQSQTGLSRQARWANVQEAFRAAPTCAEGRWLLVDDVLTTGSTVAAAARALRAAGAEAASVLTLGLARH